MNISGRFWTAETILRRIWRKHIDERVRPCYNITVKYAGGGRTLDGKDKRHISVGLLAHVDAGKTTLSEAMLYLSGRIKKLGRVDHRDSFLDNHELERARGITIFSKQAVMELEKSTVTLLDTPGHADFSAETERTLQVLDCAVLVISGTDGVQAHTETLWELLKRYALPVFVFVSKMDLPVCDGEALMEELRARFGEGCVDFTHRGADFGEDLAMCSESAMEEYLESGRVSGGTVSELIRRRELFPCFFGSGLRTDGVEELLHALDTLVPSPACGEEFGAKVYKISRDPQGNRLTCVRLTGGALKVRGTLRYRDENGAGLTEKVSQIRIYSGMKYETAETVTAGQTCALLGLSGTYPGQGLGAEPDSASPVMEPVVSCRVILPDGADPRVMLPKLRQLQEEDPQLHVLWNERSREISVQMMGKVQGEIFKSLVKERFDTDIDLGAGRIMYRETIKNKAEGVGHYEPLRHYAEVHLILEPLPRGSGVVIDTVCPEDELDRNWQRLILTHLQEKRHMGVLTGSPVTDVKITLASGRAHLKHTEGGDFRQATYRAVRQGLMRAESVLLEPYYSFFLEVPPEQTGRAISDVRAMNGTFSSPADVNGFMRIEGSAPVSAMNGYMSEVTAYTRGRGRFGCRVEGYRPCHNAQAVIDETGYDPEADVDNSPDSVFCAHGAGFTVKWDKVPEYMHLESCLRPERPAETPTPRRHTLDIDERELESIMEREFGPIRRRSYSAAVRNEAPAAAEPISNKKEYLIVDGYNVIFSWDELKELAKDNMELARGRLMDMLSNYCGYTRAELVLVFDAYRTPGNPGSRTDYHNIHVAYTGDGETGDAYIERIANEIGKNYSVRVVTSDNLIRLSALRSGVLRTSSGEFHGEVEWVLSQIDSVLKKTNEGAHTVKLKDGKQ